MFFQMTFPILTPHDCIKGSRGCFCAETSIDNLPCNGAFNLAGTNKLTCQDVFSIDASLGLARRCLDLLFFGANRKLFVGQHDPPRMVENRLTIPCLARLSCIECGSTDELCSWCASSETCVEEQSTLPFAQCEQLIYSPNAQTCQGLKDESHNDATISSTSVVHTSGDLQPQRNVGSTHVPSSRQSSSGDKSPESADSDRETSSTLIIVVGSAICGIALCIACVIAIFFAFRKRNRRSRRPTSEGAASINMTEAKIGSRSNTKSRNDAYDQGNISNFEKSLPRSSNSYEQGDIPSQSKQKNKPSYGGMSDLVVVEKANKSGNYGGMNIEDS